MCAGTSLHSLCAFVCLPFILYLFSLSVTLHLSLPFSLSSLINIFPVSPLITEICDPCMLLTAFRNKETVHFPNRSIRFLATMFFFPNFSYLLFCSVLIFVRSYSFIVGSGSQRTLVFHVKLEDNFISISLFIISRTFSFRIILP